ncbi:lysostaphin resistance A-like protein [Nocardioides sp. MAHUQ-72]|uniref:CPBP family intramembrane glutamic endopeptidase n=1 Tax=unclassified Nocardioides TaxID=2615069 RepID=UPI00360F681A
MTTRSAAPAVRRRRVEPSIGVGLAMVVAYMVVFNGLQVVAGVDYADYVDSPGNAWRAVVLPLAAGAVLLIAFVLWSGWDTVWRDPARLPMTWALRTAPLLFAAVLVLRFAGVDWGDVPADLLWPILLGGILVGFCEETLFRGIVLRCLRTGGRPESRAVLWSCLVFGGFHTGNLLFGQSVGAVAFQVVMATIAGATLYLFRRWSGLLVAGMVAHGAWDASLFLAQDHALENALSDTIGFVGLALVALAGLVALVEILVRDRDLVVGTAP